ncbi:MAG: N-acetylglucosamine-6-phosphate deacetylase [Oscillospiraceae bacterium]|jgi:N-acetylglucosamine-6-phosphate deacetylase|nr:N-acetylglucosamine-6-phosphate deacetylase [Oscillospiraceae bacterium]
MKYITNAKIVTPTGVLEGVVLAYDEKISGVIRDTDIPDNTVKSDIIDAKGNYALPGLVDIHIHGYLNKDASDGDTDGVVTMAEGVLKNGVTTFLPTTMTVSYLELEKAFDSIRAAQKITNDDTKAYANIAGIHAEGPFINANKKGAQAAENIRKPDVEFVLKHKDIIKSITIAPEVEGALDFIKRISAETDILLSQGHTDATYEQAIEGIKSGIKSTTHLFNAQTALNHRNPGVVGAALSTDIYSEIIADTFHVHKGVFQIVYNAKKDKLILITDCTRAGGMPDGEYSLGGQPIFVTGIKCLLKDGTIAGSVLKLNEAVRNFAKNTTVPVEQVVNAASLTPATAIGIADRKGSLERGKDADIVIADEEFNVLSVIKGGNRVYAK